MTDWAIIERSVNSWCRLRCAMRDALRAGGEYVLTVATLGAAPLVEVGAAAKGAIIASDGVRITGLARHGINRAR